MRNKKKESVSTIKLSKYIKQYKWQFALYLFLFVIYSAISVFIPICTAQAIEFITLNETQKAINYFIMVMLFLVLANLLGMFIDLIYNKYSMKMIREMSLDCSKQAFKLNSMTYANHGTGEFTQRIISDPGRIINSLARIIGYISSLVSAAAIIIYIIVMNYIIGLCIVGLIIIVSVIDYYRAKVREKNYAKNYKLNDKVLSITNEVVKSEKDIKMSGLEDKLNEIINERYDDYFKQNIKTYSINRCFNGGRGILTNIFIYAILIFGLVLMQKELLTMAIFMLIYSYRGSIGSFGNYISAILDIFSDVKVSMQRIKEFFDEREYSVEKFGNISLKEVKGNIKFNKVSFNYKEYKFSRDEKTHELTKELKSDMPVLKDLSFEIKPNTTVAFVGKSGSGKTTILSLISKLYDADSGEVLIDGVNIQNLDKETLRGSISLVNQFPYIFDMSIKENLKLAKIDVTDEEIERVIQDAYLKDFVDNLPDGVDTIVGESGIKLSGGQRQRLAIARALIRKSPIILFDESTSSLDNFAQEHIKQCIDNLKGQSTIVIVAHRLSTIKNADTIFFLDEGKIVDEGTFEELYDRNQTFKDMFTLENIQEKFDEKNN